MKTAVLHAPNTKIIRLKQLLVKIVPTIINFSQILKINVWIASKPINTLTGMPQAASYASRRINSLAKKRTNALSAVD